MVGVLAMLGGNVVVDVGVEPPGSVVIATEPPVVLTHAARPRHMTAVATTRTGMPIPPTIVVPLAVPTAVPPAANTPPIDELSSTEATLAGLRQVVQSIAAGDLGSQTPCREFDVAALTGHLMNSIVTIGGAAEADLPPRNRDGAPMFELVTLIPNPAPGEIQECVVLVRRGDGDAHAVLAVRANDDAGVGRARDELGGVLGQR